MKTNLRSYSFTNSKLIGNTEHVVGQAWPGIIGRADAGAGCPMAAGIVANDAKSVGKCGELVVPHAAIGDAFVDQDEGVSGTGDFVTSLFLKPAPPRGIGMLCARS